MQMPAGRVYLECPTLQLWNLSERLFALVTICMLISIDFWDRLLREEKLEKLQTHSTAIGGLLNTSVNVSIVSKSNTLTTSPNFDASSWDFVDKIIYISLDKSVERETKLRRDFLPAFGKASTDIIRFSGFEPPPGLPGDYGCSLSHLAALQLALTSNFSNVLILEDDVSWRLSANRTNFLLLQRLVQQSFDVILLGATTVHHNATTHRVTYAHSTGSYLVAGHYLQTLINNVAEGLHGFVPNRIGNDYLIDVFWMRAMNAARANWFVVAPSLVVQEQYLHAFVGYTHLTKP